MMMIALMKTNPMDQSQNLPGTILSGSRRDGGGAGEIGEPERPEPVESDSVVSAMVTLPS
jgi:hypothetical protein